MKPKIIRLPKTELIPKLLLHETLQYHDRINSIAVIVEWDDTSIDVYHSDCKTSQLARMALCFFKETIDDVYNG